MLRVISRREKRMKKLKMHQLLAWILAIVMLSGYIPQEINLKGIKFFKNTNKVQAATTLQNPRIVEDSSMDAGQRVTWDCVWFGNYPQSEVTSKEKNIYNTLESATGWDSNNDITINGIKYRRLKAIDATYYDKGELFDDTDCYYDWKNDYNKYHYFKYEPIKWRILEVSDGKAFLLSDIALDNQLYSDGTEGITWEISTMRSWLNGYDSSQNKEHKDCSFKNFINLAFSEQEQGAIKDVKVVNDDGIDGAEGGNDTRDKIYLLSEKEICSTEAARKYGFKVERDIEDEARRSKYSNYTYAMGTGQSTEEGCKNLCSWWLRSPSINDVAIFTEKRGNLSDCSWGYDFGIAIRPVLYLDISDSSAYTYAGIVSSSGTATEPVNKQNLNVELGKDNFSFINTESSYPLIKGVKYDRDYFIYDMDYSIIDNSKFSQKDKYAMKKSLEDFGGGCYGMSSLTFQLFKKKVDLKVLQKNAKTPFDLKAPASNKTVRNYVGLYQSSCETSTYQNARSEFSDKTQKEILEILISKLKRIEIEKNPILIDYAWIGDLSLDEVDRAHAVLAYGIETEGAPYRWEGIDYEYKIKIIDPNTLYTSNMDEEILKRNCLYITKDMTRCYVPEGGEYKDGSNYPLKTGTSKDVFLGKLQIQFVTNDEKFIPVQNSAEILKYDSICAVGSMIKIDGKKITGFQGTTAGIYGKYIIPGGRNNGIQVFIDKKPHEIEVSKDSQKINIFYQDNMQSVSASQGSKIKINNGKLDLKNKQNSFEIAVVANKKIPNTNRNIMYIQGTGKKEITVELMNKGISITGENLSNVNVVTEDGKTKKIPYNGNVIIKEQGNNIVIERKETKISKITLSGISKKIAAGKKITLKPSILPTNASNKKLNWKSSNTKVATVTQSGIVTLKKKTGGKKVTITATATDGSKAKASWQITSMQGVVNKVKITGNKTIKAGKKLKLKAKVAATKKANTKLLWTSNNVRYATVNARGVVTTKKSAKGKKVKIIAMATDGSGKKGTVTIKIK